MIYYYLYLYVYHIILFCNMKSFDAYQCITLSTIIYIYIKYLERGVTVKYEWCVYCDGCKAYECERWVHDELFFF